MQAEGLKGLIFGGTGATGADLVASLLASPKWSKVTCVARKSLAQWANLPGKQKLEVQISQNMDDYFKQENKTYAGYDTVFCCLGTQVKHGDETFIKIDKTYPLWAADIALRNKIPHYLLVSSMGSNPNSWFLYPRTKGEVQNQLKQKGLNLLTILKPGLLRNRRDARPIQRFIKHIPFLPGMQAKDSSQTMRIIAQRYHEQALNSTGAIQVFQNNDMQKIFDSEKL